MLIESDHFHALLEHVQGVAPDLLTTCRWLACGPGMAPLILGEEVAEPSPADLVRLAGLLETAPLQVATAGHSLFAVHRRLVAEHDVALERLLATERPWSHPIQVLGRYRAGFAQLLAACDGHLESARGNRRRQLETVRQKLERAVTLEAKARQRRERFGTTS